MQDMQLQCIEYRQTCEVGYLNASEKMFITI